MPKNKSDKSSAAREGERRGVETEPRAEKHDIVTVNAVNARAEYVGYSMHEQQRSLYAYE